MGKNSAPIADPNPGFWMHPDVARLIDRACRLIERRVMRPVDANNAGWSCSALEWTVHSYIRELTALSDAGLPMPAARYEPTRRQFRAHPTFENFAGFCARFGKWLDKAEAKYTVTQGRK
jgi:hypothetical protein